MDISTIKLLGKSAILFLIIAAYLALLNQGVLLAPTTPLADIAADMLLENNLRDDGYLLVGHYSRWRFNHPGPFWFYVNHFFEYIFQWLFLSRFQVWFVGSVFVNSGFILFSALALSAFFFKRINFRFALCFSLLVIGYIGYEISILWMPNRLITPYLAFLVCLLHIAQRDFRYFAISVLLGCMLVHGYITMPVFTVLPMVVALLFSCMSSKRTDVRGELSIQLYGAAIIVFIFGSPMLIDAVVFDNSNFSKIMAAQVSFSQETHFPSYLELMSVIAQVMLHHNALGWIVASIVVFLLLAIKSTRYFIEQRGIFILCSLLLTTTLSALFYYKQTPAPIYPFVVQFLVAVPMLLVALLLAVIFRLADANLKPVAECPVWLQFGGLAFILIASFSLPLKAPIKSETNKLTDVVIGFSDFIRSAYKGRPIAIAYAEKSHWDLMAGLLLELDRQGIKPCAVQQDMAFLYTKKYICNALTIPDIQLVDSHACHQNCLIEKNGYALKAYSLSHIKLGDPVSAESTKAAFLNWSEPESDYRWSLGLVSTVVLDYQYVDFVEPKGELRLHFASLGRQQISISINQIEVFSGVVDSPNAHMLIQFPSSLLKEGKNTIAFQLPDARQPELGNGDRRKLALALKSIQID